MFNAHWQRCVWSLALATFACGACVNSPRSETAGAAAPSPSNPDADVKARQKDSLPAAAPAAPEPANLATEQASQPPAGPREFASPPDESAAPRQMLEEVLRPQPGDAEQLQQALEDLQSAAQSLSSGHSCEEACKAYQSMQRAAERICGLTPSNDPAARCNAARTRVSSANQELRRRCGAC